MKKVKQGYRLTVEAVNGIEAEAERLGVSHTSVVEMAVREYLSSRKKEVRVEEDRS